MSLLQSTTIPKQTPVYFSAAIDSSQALLKRGMSTDSFVQNDSSQISQESLHSTELSSPSLTTSETQKKGAKSSQISLKLDSDLVHPDKTVEKIAKKSNVMSSNNNNHDIPLKGNFHLLTSSAFHIMLTNEERIKFFYSKICHKSINGDSMLEEIPRQKVSKFEEIYQSESHSKLICPKPRINSIVLSSKRIESEPGEVDMEDLKSSDQAAFPCIYCESVFRTGQALGGHMSRRHSGKSEKYNHKKDVRKQREIDRMRLYAAKKKYLKELGYNYDDMSQTSEGKVKAKTLMNRCKLKKIKNTLTEKEIIALNAPDDK